VSTRCPICQAKKDKYGMVCARCYEGILEHNFTFTDVAIWAARKALRAQRKRQLSE
jgi:hypothetical protein